MGGSLFGLLVALLVVALAVLVVIIVIVVVVVVIALALGGALRAFASAERGELLLVLGFLFFLVALGVLPLPFDGMGFGPGVATLFSAHRDLVPTAFARP